ncbi:hypothetical protein BN1723_007660, partial [Verticillium longisporum]
ALSWLPAGVHSDTARHWRLWLELPWSERTFSQSRMAVTRLKIHVAVDSCFLCVSSSMRVQTLARTAHIF